MNPIRCLSALCLYAWIVQASPLLSAELPVSGLSAEFSHGQVFLTWREPEGAHGGTFNVYIGDRPLTDLGRARLLASRIEAHSARDWWGDPATYFEADSTGSYKPTGFVIREGGPALDPQMGLFVHTVAPGDPGKVFYAVTMTAGGVEDSRVVPGVNSLANPVEQAVQPVEPVWQGALQDKPASGAAEGLPVVMSLHGRGGREKVSWLAFGGPEAGWREGLPFKFFAVATDSHLQITPTDRTWVGRTLSESWDSRDHFSPVIDTFWYGYNDRIFDLDSMALGTPVNFTERRNLWLLGWARRYFRPDTTRMVLEGGSMGGCGGLSWGLRHPELFCAVVSDVPLVGYFGPEWGGSEKRLAAFCGPLDRPCSDSPSLRTRMDSRTVLAESAASGRDLPFLVISNARHDMSIPWKPNPRYYRFLDSIRAGCVVAWDNRDHATCMSDPDSWFRKWHDPAWLAGLLPLDRSCLAFSRASRDNDPGPGDPAIGDSAGYFNYGLEWSDILDTPERYEATVRYEGAGGVSPLSVDITPRRVQRFRVSPGARVRLVERGPDGAGLIDTVGTADRSGHVTFSRFRLESPDGGRLIILPVD